MRNHSVSPLFFLLVDDDADLRDPLKEHLEKIGFQVEACGSCEEARMALSKPEASFQLVLADVLLPDGDGLDVIKAAKQRDPNTLGAVMTGYASLDTALKAIRVGAYDYITKPFSLDEIDILARNMTEKLKLVDQTRRAEERLYQIYSKLELLQGERIELMRVNRDIKGEFEKMNRKLDEISSRFPRVEEPVLETRGDSSAATNTFLTEVPRS